MKLSSVLGLITAILLPSLVFAYLKAEKGMDPLFMFPRGHFYIVSSVAILATIIAAIVGIAGTRMRNMKVTFLSLAFVSLAEVFVVHGLSTPHFLLPPTHLPGTAAQLSILLASFWLWLSSLAADHPLPLFLSHGRVLLLPIWTAGLALLGIFSLLFPNLTDLIPLDANPLNVSLTIALVILNAITMYRYFQSYRYSRFPLQLSIVYSCGWLIVSQFIMVTGETWRLSWWIYHFLLLASMFVMILGLFKQYAANQSVIGALHALFTNDPIERVTTCISPSVKALIIATETKDVYTAGHNLRVTLYALKLAEELSLSPEQLRAIAQGTIVHDVGKINIPDIILNKPGKLTSEERSIIETHPIKGFEMCKNLGFMKEELQIIRSHHEKWDGSGYPDHLRAYEIPLLARVVSVADVYDALTSTRAYRKSWTHYEAIQFLDEQKGTQFDADCVDAWIRICEQDSSVYKYPLQSVNEKTTLTPFL